MKADIEGPNKNSSCIYKIIVVFCGMSHGTWIKNKVELNCASATTRNEKKAQIEKEQKERWKKGDRR